MYYAKQIDADGNIIALHTMNRPFYKTAEFTPITEVEYNRLLAEMEQEKE